MPQSTPSDKTTRPLTSSRSAVHSCPSCSMACLRTLSAFPKPVHFACKQKLQFNTNCVVVCSDSCLTATLPCEHSHCITTTFQKLRVPSKRKPTTYLVNCKRLVYCCPGNLVTPVANPEAHFVNYRMMQRFRITEFRSQVSLVTLWNIAEPINP